MDKQLDTKELLNSIFSFLRLFVEKIIVAEKEKGCALTHSEISEMGEQFMTGAGFSKSELVKIFKDNEVTDCQYQFEMVSAIMSPITLALAGAALDKERSQRE